MSTESLTAVNETHGLLGMSYHDNDVRLPFTPRGYKLIKATYTITDFSITPGQDPEGRNKVGQQKTWSGTSGSIGFQTGRSNSSAVANWWKSKIADNQSTFGHAPGELNFAFIGTLTLQLSGGVLGANQDTYTLNNVAFGQGHSGSTNNWWFGSTSGLYIDNHTVRVTGQSTSGYNVNFYFLRGGFGSDADEIELYQINYISYKTYGLLAEYRGENTADVWQKTRKGGAGKCPPYVTYYNSTQSATLKISVKSGKLYDSSGGLFDTSTANVAHTGQPVAIFVVDSNGDLYASRQFKVFLFHHSTILGGDVVASAGELEVKGGVITWMSSLSGHYRPDSATAHLQLSEALYRQGYHTPIPQPFKDETKLVY